MATSELIIRIGAESKQFTEELDKISAETANLEGQLSDLAKISGAVFTALIAEAGLAIHAFGEQERASNSLSQALQNQGIYSDDLAQSYKDQAAELQKLTGVDDDAIIKSQAVLQGLIGQQEITPQLTKSILDLANAKEMDLDTTAQLIGKAINGQTAALKRLGIEIDDNLSKQERTAQIVERVTQAYGGQAEAAARGVGSTKGLVSAFSDLQEEIGSRLAPVFTFLVKTVTEFFQFVSGNKALVDLIVSVGVAATTVAGLTLALGAGAIAFLKIRAAMLAAGIAAEGTSLAVKGLVGATGIGLLLIIATELFLNWNSIWPKMQAVFVAFVNNVGALGSSLGKILLGILNPRTGLSQIKEGYNELKNVLSKGMSDYETVLEESHKKQQASDADHHGKQNAAQKAAADKRAAILKESEDQLLLSRQLHLDAMALAEDNASTTLIDITKKEGELRKSLAEATSEQEKELIREQIAVVTSEREDQRQQEFERRIEFNDEILAQNEDFQAMSVDQQQQFLDQNQSQLLAQINTDQATRKQATLTRSQEQIKANNQYLVDQQKFGTNYALINKAMHSEIYQGSKNAFQDLAQLQNSSNATLKSIGKAAAIANIAFSTAEAAMRMIAGFSVIPIVGPTLGYAAAAAVVAYGAEQIGRVTSAADGGLITGGIAGKDSVPSLLMGGELVVPQRNFSEVVGAVAAQQNQETSSSKATSSGTGADGSVAVAIGFDGQEAESVITARQVEARALGTLRSR